MFRSTTLFILRQFTIGFLVVSILLPSGFVAVAIAGEDQPKPKAGVEKGTLDDVRQIVDLARDIRDLIKSVPAGDLNKAAGRDKSAPGHEKLALNAAEIREFIGLARDVRDLVKDFPKSAKSVSVPDLSGLLTYVGPIYDAVKATPDAGGDKIGLADVAAAVALARAIRDLTKSAPAAKSGEKIIGVDDLAAVAAAVSIASEVRNLFKSLPIDETKSFGGSFGVSLPGVSVGGSVVVKSAEPVEKGTLDDVRQIVDLARDIRDLIKSVPAGDLNKAAGRDKSAPGHEKLALNAAEIREFIGLARDVRDLVKDFPKSTKSVSVPDLSGLLTYVGPIYDAVKATPDAGGDKIGLADVAAAVALARAIRDLTKSAPAAKSGEKIIGVDDLAAVAAAVSIASEVRNLFKSLPIDETKKFGFSGSGGVSLPGFSAGGSVEIKKAGEETPSVEELKKNQEAKKLIQDTEPQAILDQLILREGSFLANKDANLGLALTKLGLDKTLYHDMGDSMLPHSKMSTKRLDTPSVDLFKGISDTVLINRLKDDIKVVYGDDDRKDLYEVEASRDLRRRLGMSTDSMDRMLENARSVCCIQKTEKLLQIPNTTTSLVVTSKYNVCASERFSGQPVGAFCTGFIVDTDIIATAGHCITNDADAKNSVFVFDFRVPSGGSFPTDQVIVDNSQVYQGVELLGRQREADGPDWALVRLDRKISGRKILALRTSGSLSTGAGVYVIGHPSGLPMKIADNAVVRNDANPAFYVTNLDTYGGNSGSPVFSADTHQVEGILVRGGQDFSLALNGDVGCYQTVYVGPTEGRGEDVTRISIILDKIKSVQKSDSSK